MFGYKVLAYKYEREVRIILDKTPGNLGRNEREPSDEIFLSIDPNDVIRSVVVAPEAEPWFFTLVKNVTKRYQVESPVTKSILARKPIG